MFDFLRKKKATSGRAAVFEDFRQAAEELKAADSITRIKVGMSINIASTAFASTFKEPSGFQSIPQEQQLEYMAKFRTAQEQARAKHDSAAALGSGLFNMWLCALTTKDDELMALIKPELAKLSQEADVVGSVL
jgi:hypothetical protein